MDQEIFSNTLEIFEDAIENPLLQYSVDSIIDRFDDMNPKLFKWDEGRIALGLTVPVELPPLGNFEGLKISSREPVLIVFDLKNYPSTPPIVFTDRLDFPKDNLAHLYIAKNGKPPAFCLVKGNMGDWYANKRSIDLVLRISNWFWDAVTGGLSENGNQFDPLRLEGYSGTLIYDYDRFFEIVEKNKLFPNLNFVMAIFERKEGSYVFKTFINAENIKENETLLTESFKKEKAELPTPHYHIGYLVTNLKMQSYANYNIDKPEKLSELESYCLKYDVDLTDLKSFISKTDINHFRGIPLIVGIKRPKKVIGFDGDIEFVNFVMVVGAEHKINDTLDGNLSVSLSSHSQPLTFKKAQQVSGNTAKFDGINYVFGCGALGSKIILHLSRSGITNFILYDPDTISPHNMVRHSLMGLDVGKSKVSALKEAIDQFYPIEESNTHAVKGISDPTLKAKFLNLGNWIFDFTASECFFNTLVNADNLTDPNIVKGSISDFGNLGILLIEGKNRHIRIDDMIQTLYYTSKSTNWVYEWLQREYQANQSTNLSVRVGVGCNSETTILSDDKISSHAAYFTGILKKESTRDDFQGGKIYLNRIIDTDDYKISTEVLTVEPFLVLKTVNDTSWEIRMANSLDNKLIKAMEIAFPNETGGVFIGSINYKTKTVHVLDLIYAPADSCANEVCFHRGIEGLPELVETVNERSGGQLGYIGEWHSHPKGPDGLSAKDFETVHRFKTELSELTTPLPVFLTIITPNKIMPYVF